MLSTVRETWWVYVTKGVLAILFGTTLLATAVLFPATTATTLVLLFGAYLIVTGAVAVVAALWYRKKSIWGSLLLNVILGLTLGVLTFIWTDVTVVALMVMLAVWAIATGLVEIITTLRLHRGVKREWMMTAFGLIAVVLGALILLYPAIGLLAEMWLIGGYIALYGVFTVILGTRIHHRRGPGQGHPTSAHGEMSAETGPA
jgi:uncharacterized membrane protein HdeD (DUF308 family)